MSLHLQLFTMQGIHVREVTNCSRLLSKWCFCQNRDRASEPGPNDSLRRSSGSSFNVNRFNLQLAANSAWTQKVLPLKSHLSLFIYFLCYSQVLSGNLMYSWVESRTLMFTFWSTLNCCSSILSVNPLKFMIFLVLLKYGKQTNPNSSLFLTFIGASWVSSHYNEILICTIQHLGTFRSP